MSATAVVTFTDKIKFNAKKTLETVQLPPILTVDHQLIGEDHGSSLPPSQSLCDSRGGVIFQPRYYKHIELKKEGERLAFTDRLKRVGIKYHQCDRYKPVRMVSAGDECLKETWRVFKPTNCSLSTAADGFRTCFKPLGTRDIDFVEKAKCSLACSSWPYVNSRPHQHRQLDCSSMELRTRKTPDPFNIHFKNALIADQLSSVDDSNDPINDEIGFTTRKTPELPFQPRLYFPKGRYSPAFTAHNAFLDRIAKSFHKSLQE